jgi:hypothetical protein
MTVRIANYETSCRYAASDSKFNEGAVMECIVTCATGVYEYLSEISSEI